MKNILIVDDEKFIRQGISLIIENEFEEKVIIELAKNGEEAYEKLLNSKYDLLITDINMPKMDGIELIEKAASLTPTPEIIVLSGFNEFEYARQCMKFGVRNYLLKPIEREELIRIIKELFNNIEEKHDENEEQILKELKYKLSNEKRDYENINRLLKKLDLNSNFYKIYYVKGDTKNIEVHNNRDDNFVFLTDEENSGYLISNIENLITAKDYDSVIESDMESDIFHAFETVENLKNYQMILGKSHIKPHDIHDKKYFPFNDDKVIGIYKYLKIGKLEIINDIFNFIFSADKIEIYDFNSFKEIHESFIRNIFYKENEFENLNKSFEKLEFENICEYLDALRAALESLAKKLSSSNKIEIMYIDEAKEYIAKHYAKEINMAVVSNHVSLNYSYFSTLFKKYTNMNFSDYLNFVRVEESKKYLDRADYKIYEISEMVGYKNSKHYTKVFKKIENITPVEYRLRNIER